MAKATEEGAELTYEDVRDENSKFQARVARTNIKGVRNLTLTVTRPFQNSEELADWLQSGVVRLEKDLREQGI